LAISGDWWTGWSFCWLVFDNLFRGIRRALNYTFLAIEKLGFSYPFHFFKIELDKFLNLIFTAFQISEIKVETSGYNTKHLLLMFLTVLPQAVNKPNLITNNFMVG
jgi:hypothetical protein